MKTPSKLKVGFDLVLAGALLALAATQRPYDRDNLILGFLGLLWLVSAAIDFDRHY